MSIFSGCFRIGLSGEGGLLVMVTPWQTGPAPTVSHITTLGLLPRGGRFQDSPHQLCSANSVAGSLSRARCLVSLLEGVKYIKSSAGHFLIAKFLPATYSGSSEHQAAHSAHCDSETKESGAGEEQERRQGKPGKNGAPGRKIR